MCGFFCISSRSLKVPGSDSSALQTRYLSMSPLGQERRPCAPPGSRRRRGRGARGVELVDDLLGLHRQRLAQRLVAAAALVDLERREPGLVDVLNSIVGLRSLLASTGRRMRAAACPARGPAVRRAVLDDRAGVARPRAVRVLAVDRGHRRDVAGPEALERAHVDVGSPGGRIEHLRVELVGAAQRARDVRAHVDVVAADLGSSLEHVVEGRHRRQVGGRHPHHGGDLRRSPRASTSRAPAGRRASAGIAAEWRSG